MAACGVYVCVCDVYDGLCVICECVICECGICEYGICGVYMCGVYMCVWCVYVHVVCVWYM